MSFGLADSARAALVGRNVRVDLAADKRHDLGQRDVHVSSVVSPQGAAGVGHPFALVAGVVDRRDEQPRALSLFDAAGGVEIREGDPDRLHRGFRRVRDDSVAVVDREEWCNRGAAACRGGGVDAEDVLGRIGDPLEERVFGGVWPQADHPAMQPVCVIERQAGIAPKRSLTIGTLPPTRIAETSTFFTSA